MAFPLLSDGVSFLSEGVSWLWVSGWCDLVSRP